MRFTVAPLCRAVQGHCQAEIAEAFPHALNDAAGAHLDPDDRVDDRAAAMALSELLAPGAAHLPLAAVDMDCCGNVASLTPEEFRTHHADKLAFVPDTFAASVTRRLVEGAMMAAYFAEAPEIGQIDLYEGLPIPSRVTGMVCARAFLRFRGLGGPVDVCAYWGAYSNPLKRIVTSMAGFRLIGIGRHARTFEQADRLAGQRLAMETGLASVEAGLPGVTKH